MGETAERRHPTAVIHTATRIPEEVTIGPYAVIEDGVEIGEGTVIQAHAVIRSGSVIGKNCHIDSHTVVGGLPQDLSFKPGTPSGVRIGDGVTLREGVTVNRATKEATFTEIGDNCFLMANCHIAHDCRLGRQVIIANNVPFGGFVTVGDHAFIGGNAGVHQFCRIGESVMVAGGARVTQDIPPFCMLAERNELIGLNLIGLQRRGFEREVIRELKHLFHMVFDIEGRPRVLAEGALRDGLARTTEGRAFLEFLATESRKGVARPRKGGR